MCGVCGCGTDPHPPHDPAHGAHAHGHGDHAHGHGEHAHGHGERTHALGARPHPHQAHAHDRDGEVHGRALALEIDLLARNDRLAAENRARFAERSIVAVNLTSSPGSGKTTLVERTVRELLGVPIGVIEGDQATDRDAERIRAAGCRAVQINTGAGCHLEADMVRRGFEALDLPDGALLIVENVGNLVCPSLFDLGERARVVVMSVTEGEDKPIKYPHMFRSADRVVLNKIDLLPYLDFDLGAFEAHLAAVNPRAPVVRLSARTGEGFGAWLDWLGGLRGRR